MKRFLYDKKKWVVLLGILLVVGVVAYNSDGQGGVPNIFGHSAGEVEGIDELVSDDYILTGDMVLLVSPYVVMSYVGDDGSSVKTAMIDNN